MTDQRLLRRRQLLQSALASAAGQCLPGRAAGQPRLGFDPFVLGVASGSPGPDSVVLWSRLMSSAARRLDPALGAVGVRWELAHDERFSSVVQSGQVQALPELAHSVHAEVSGLEPDRRYCYRFMLGDAVSPTGRTRTLPSPGAAVARLRLAYASCQKWEDGYFSAWRHMLAEDLDLVLFLGDYIYEYPGVSTRVRSPGGGWVIDLDGYRRRYALYKSDPDLQAMHQACPWLLTWDDHEVQNDYAGLQAGNSGSRDPSVARDFALRRDAAYQAYYEHMPLRASVLAGAAGSSGATRTLRVHDRVWFGRLASVHLLDTRQYRDPMVCTRAGALGSGLVDPASCPAWNDPQRSLLGWPQERWLEQSLAARDTLERRWSLIAQQTLFGRRDLRPGPLERYSNDGWDGYPAARRRLTDALRRHQVPNAVVLGGDVHANWVGHVKADYARADSAVVGVEFCGTSITSRGGGNAGLAERLVENPHFVFADSERRGYGVVELTPDSLMTRLRVVDDVARPDSAISTLATFEVKAGSAAVERRS